MACPECGHEHSGIDLAYICIGCPCERRPDPGPVPAPPAETRRGMLAVCEQLNAHAARFKVARDELAQADPQVWWLLTAGDILHDAAIRIAQGMERARKVYGDDLIERADRALRAEPPPAPPAAPPQDVWNLAQDYMADRMAMPNVLTDQEQNWIFGHLVTFALSLYPERAAERAAPAPAEPDEEMTPHAFNSRTPYEAGDDRDIWCKDCEYHRDHKIHAALASPSSTGAENK